MKPNHHLTALGALLLATATSLPAQEEKAAPPVPPPAQNEEAPRKRDPQPETPPPARKERPDTRKDAPPPARGQRPEARPESRRDAPQRGTTDTRGSSRSGREAPPPAERRVTYIGVLTAPLSPEMRAHLRLPEGFGLRVIEVLRGSPAAAADIHENDVLIRFEDQRLASMEQLQALVREKKKGDSVKLHLISSGQPRDVQVQIEEHTLPAPSAHDPRRMGFPSTRPHDGRPPHQAEHHRSPAPERGSHLSEGMDFRRHADEWREKFEQQQKAWREWQERFREWSREHGRHFPQPPLMPSFGMERPGPEGREGGPPPEQREASTITRSDESGVYTLKKQGEARIFTAQPKGSEGKSWNLNREEERRSIPEELRGKLGQLEELHRGEARARQRE